MDDDGLDTARRVFVEHLNALGEGRWTLDGGRAIGPGGFAAVFRNDDGSRGHIDIGFILDRSAAAPVELWVCSTGVGDTTEAALNMAVEGWVRTTWPVVQELDGASGAFADHLHGEETGGWHVVQGPWVGLDRGDGAGEALGAWADSHPVIATIGPIVAHEFTRGTMNCVKILLASTDEPVADVMVNGVRNEEASYALLGLDWPKTGHAVQKSVAVFLERDPDAAAAVSAVPTGGNGPPPPGAVTPTDFAVAALVLVVGIGLVWKLRSR